MVKTISIVAILGLVLGLLLLYWVQRDPLVRPEPGTIAVALVAGQACAGAVVWLWKRLLPRKPPAEGGHA
jgi:hypothetical protein